MSVYISGDELRDIAGYVIDQCVHPAKEAAGGGYIIRGLANAINWVVKPGVKYDNPYRKLSLCVHVIFICPFCYGLGRLIPAKR